MVAVSRTRCVVYGLLISAPGVVWLCFVFCMVWMLTGDVVGTLAVRLNPPGLAVVLMGVLPLHVGILLVVKAVCNPPRFWRHTGRHLAMASTIAWSITVALFVVFAVMP